MGDKYNFWPPKDGYPLTGSTSEGNVNSNVQMVDVNEIINTLSSLTINTLVKPEVDYSDFPEYVTRNENISITPEVIGSNVKFSIHNQPSGMKIDSNTGRVTYHAKKVSDFNNIVISHYNEFHSGSTSINLEVRDFWFRDSKLIEFYDCKRYQANKKGWRKNNTNQPGLINNSVTQKPVLFSKLINNVSVPYFDGVDDYLYSQQASYDKSIKSGIILFKPEVDENSYSQIIGSYDFGVHLAIDNRNGNKNGYSFDGNSKSDFKNKGFVMDVSSEDYVRGVYKENSNDVRWDNNEWNKIYFEYEESITFKDQFRLGCGLTSGVHTFFYKGYVMFIALFNDVLSDAEIDDIKDWLKSRYGL